MNSSVIPGLFRGQQRLRSQSFYGILPVVVCLALLWPFGGGRKVDMMSGTKTPGAGGVIIVKKGGNGNTSLDIKAHSLAPPSSLTPAENVYVVWIEPPGHSAQNHGQVAVNQHENAEIHTETPYKRFKVFITAEQNAQVRMPEGPRVLSATVAQK